VAAAGGPPKPKMENKSKEIIFAVENGVAKAVPVKRGISSDQYVEITEGVTDGMEVVSGSYKAINRELEDGAKVRIEEQKKGPQQKPEGA
jgi:HlyD family secretion protein